MPDQPTDRDELESKPEPPSPATSEVWKTPPEKETDPSKLVDIADPSTAPEEGAY